ncbi:HpcH/HpaI aldolase/citrate lyase family protein [Plastoroseomonas hellenica]|uniref:HpcH/HpaI aldolase/citrate lyase family protein n=1 Tax=Plastoroseomonas hellenica TaxID=2687306 RepID=UPI001BAA5E7E|nr:CoA ester lyase [Plastoroseomonas hellenica]MBR0641705.1 CoA ester lyase [Plastoroseomonas hellenica]
MRSFLFVPGDSERKFARAAAGAADALILDLEDSVGMAGKPAARQITAGMLAAPRGRQQRYVRVNALDTGMTLADLAAVMPARPDGIVLPKCADAGQVRQVSLWLDAFEAAADSTRGATRILAIATETAGSLFGLGGYAEAGPRLSGLMWGAEDLSASLGASANRLDGQWLAPFRLARNLCLAGAAAAGVPAIDTVHVDIDDLVGLEADAREARRDGFGAKAVIHPKHVDVVNAVFTPAPAELDWARRVVAAFAEAGDAGVLRMDGKMLDRPHLRLAERLLAAAGE